VEYRHPAHPESLGHPLTGAGFGGIGSITFSPDGRTLAVVNGDGAIQLWNIDNPSHPEPGPQIISGNNSTIASMTFNPDGNILATVDYSGDLQLWNAVHPPSVQIALGSATAPSNGPILPTLAYSPSGRILTLLPGNGTVELWNVVNPADPNELGQLPTATTGLVDAIAFSQQGILASVDGDGAIQLWTAADPAHPRPFGQPIAGSSAIISVAFSPDGTMASGTSTGTIVLWDLHVSDAIKRICTTAGGNLTPQNWHNYISQLPYQSPCGP